MIIRVLNAHSEGARNLLALSDTYMSALYPAESNHLENPDALAQANVHFVGGYVDAELIACGAVKTMTDDGIYGEIKRVYVVIEQRGNGFSRQIMQLLEEHLRSNNVRLARLETGTRQPEALSLYRKLGYVERAPFGKYRPDPLSIFMEKRIGA